MRFYLRLLIACCALSGLLLTVGCQTATEPFTGRTQYLMSVSPEEECQMGLEAWQEVLKTTPVSGNPQMNISLLNVGKAIQAVASGPGTSAYQWEFKVLKSKEANAFCLPGGKVAVYEGIFQYMSNEAELAAVVGHEVGHAVARHGIERMTDEKVAGFVGSALSVALQTQGVQGSDAIMAAFGLGAQVGVLLPFSRKQEYAADQIGLMYMARAGYKPEAALDFWIRFADKNSGQKSLFSDWLSTHPLDDKRIAHMRELLPQAAAEYQAAANKKAYGARWR